MMKFDHIIEHIQGTDNVIADTLSRMCSDDDDVKLPKINFISPSVNKKTLINETCCDKFIADLKRRILTSNWSNTTEREKQFKRVFMQLSIDDDGLVRYGSLVVPPSSAYIQLFNTAYQSHNGMHSTLNLLQREFFWPNMRRTVESMVRGCEECSKARFSPKNTTHKWPKEEEVWSRIH